jgi:predicted ATPase
VRPLQRRQFSRPEVLRRLRRRARFGLPCLRSPPAGRSALLRCCGAPLGLIGVAPRFAKPGAWGSKTYYTQLTLGPLPPETAEELLHALLGEDPHLQPLRQLLVERTERNPFFLEESVRALIETGVLIGEPGAYRVLRAQPSIPVPATIQAVLAARIDRLPPAEKSLLQAAAVIGKRVPFTLLEAIAAEPELHLSLAHLQAAEFLYETSLSPELEYTFKHAVTHDVAYTSLLQQQRRDLHARIVTALEKLSRDRQAEHVDQLAHHAFRGEVWDKAVIYLRQAGAKGTARSAYREAVSCFEQALEALGHLPRSRDTRALAIDLRLDLRTALHSTRALPGDPWPAARRREPRP